MIPGKFALPAVGQPVQPLAVDQAEDEKIIIDDFCVYMHQFRTMIITSKNNTFLRIEASRYVMP